MKQTRIKRMVKQWTSPETTVNIPKEAAKKETVEEVVATG